MDPIGVVVTEVLANFLRVHCSSEITWGDLDENTKFINITLPQVTNQLPYDPDNDPCLVNWVVANQSITEIQSSNNVVIDLTNNYSLSRVGLFIRRYKPYYNEGTNFYGAGTTNYSMKKMLFHKSVLETTPLKLIHNAGNT